MVIGNEGPSCTIIEWRVKLRKWDSGFCWSRPVERVCRGIVSPIRPGPSRPVVARPTCWSTTVLVRGGGGITAVFHTSLTCSQNRVEDMRHWGILSLVGFAKCAMTENRVLNCGYQQAPSIGIGASQQLGELCVESCEVMNTGVSPDNTTISALSWVSSRI